MILLTVAEGSHWLPFLLADGKEEMSGTLEEVTAEAIEAEIEEEGRCG